MSTLKLFAGRARSHVPWLALVALAVIVAACNNAGGSGY